MNQSRSDQLPFLMSNLCKISLQPRALCFRDLREEEPSNSHPHIQILVLWIRYSVPSGHRSPSHGHQVPGRTALQFASGLCTQISLVGNQNARFRVQARAGGAGMQWDLSPVWQKRPGHCQGLGALQHSQILSVDAAASPHPLAKPCHSRCKGAVLGPLLICVLSHISAFQIPFLFLCYCLPFPLHPSEITSEHLQNRMRGNQFSRQKWYYRNTPPWPLLLQTK